MHAEALPAAGLDRSAEKLALVPHVRVDGTGLRGGGAVFDLGEPRAAERHGDHPLHGFTNQIIAAASSPELLRRVPREHVLAL